jgi:dethiobiotin synthetase
MRETFITGVGTGVGKTLVTTALCFQLNRLGRPISALKPVVSGYDPGDRDSDPALILRSLGRSPAAQAIAAVAPWRFRAPLSPHLAARQEGRSLNLNDIVAFCRAHERKDDGVLLVEGAGGVMTPIDRRETVLDLIVRLGYGVVLVTGSYLGALSHTLTAVHALRTGNVTLSGIVVSESADSAGLDETIESLGDLVGEDVLLLALPRLPDAELCKWRVAPELTKLCALAPR